MKCTLGTTTTRTIVRYLLLKRRRRVLVRAHSSLGPGILFTTRAMCMRKLKRILAHYLFMATTKLQNGHIVARLFIIVGISMVERYFKMCTLF